MGNLDPNIFTIFEDNEKKNWWSLKLFYKDIKKNNAAVRETCETFMKRVNEKRICIGAGCYGQAWIIQLDGKPKEFVQKIYMKIESKYEIIYESDTLICCAGEYIPKLIYSGFNLHGQWCTIMEFFKGGTLWHHLNQDEEITAEGKKFIAYELALALEYIHGKKYTHGDLKTDNIVLTENGNVRLIDFGKSRYVSYDDRKLPQQVDIFMAPEIWREDKAGVASDRWSYAVVLCILIQGEAPFGSIERPKQEIYEDTISKEPNLNNINDEDAKDLIRKLLNPNPVQRYAEATKHAYFRGLKKYDDPPFKPGKVEIKHIDVPKNGDRCFTDDTEVYVKLMKETLMIPTTAYLESMMKPTIVNKETKNPPTCDKLKELTPDNEKNIQVVDGKVTKPKGAEEVIKPKAVKNEPNANGKEAKPKDGRKETKQKAAKKKKSGKKSEKFSIFKKIKKLLKKNNSRVVNGKISKPKTH